MTKLFLHKQENKQFDDGNYDIVVNYLFKDLYNGNDD